MEDLLNCFAFKKVPTVERTRKRDFQKEAQEESGKKPKLLQDVLSGENPPSFVPSYTTKGIVMNKEPSSRWSRVPLPLSKRDPILAVQHWEREGGVPYTPPSDIPLHPTSVIEYTDAEYESAKCKGESWEKTNTDFLFSLCRKQASQERVRRRYNLRWPVIVELINMRFNLNLEACQLRYYTVSKLILGFRNKQGIQLTPEEEQLFKCAYDNSFCKNRRQTLDRSFLISRVGNDAEQKLYERLTAIDAQLNRITSNENVEGYGPYDDLNSIPTVMKESPVYLKPSPGVTLRSARFDNNSASSYFADNTQKRLIQILAEMNVQIPHMATKRVCDTLDRLKQDIVKLILLRKYLAQNNYVMPPPNPIMNQTTDTKKKRKSTLSGVNYSGPPKSYNR
ncbi:hypothetical protein AV274_1663 [Blastocystis sp. ATCC 50177/Nand II]|uniref:dAMP1 SANT/Myb-like domain-containing protein n=1 Tax=Blastocystis sp. subtype 1 (strain ATCC 50177 / NandII) TaxID=478820 RepID=A0A196SKA0_BLAHN|nr:hypothetical protein AV274_1663 [Blastocystis sp. ATCC 50177/Nand II]